MKRSLGLLAVCCVVTACGSSGHSTSPAPHSVPPHIAPPSPTAFRFSTASNRAFAQNDARKLLHIVRLPSSARLLTKAPAGAPRWLKNQLAHPGTSRGTAHTRGIWLVPERAAQVRHFIRAHARQTPPPILLYRGKSNPVDSRMEGDYFFRPVAGRTWSRDLSLDITQLRTSSTVVFVEAQEIWNRRPPAAAVLSSRVKRIDVTSRYYGQRKSVLVHVWNRFDVASIVSWTNGLSAGPTYVCFGYFGGGPTVTLTFRSASGRVLAQGEVGLSYGAPISGPCNPLRLTIGARAPVSLIGSDLFVRIQRLLDIDVAPQFPSRVSSCLRRAGWVVHTHHRSPVRVVAIHHGRMWVIHFPLSGKVTASKPPALAISRCLSAPRYFGYR